MSSSLTGSIVPQSGPAYLTHLMMTTLERKGFSSAEAGALAELERLLEQHIQSLFESAQSAAELSGRSTPHSGDLLFAHEMVAEGSVHKLHKMSKKRRTPIPISLKTEPPSPRREITLGTLPEIQEGDVKPRAGAMGSGERLENAFEGAPELPQKWMYDAKPSSTNNADTEGRPQLSSSLLDFIKLTATERGDIAPELGLVNYKRADGDSRNDGGTGKRRKVWGVKGVGIGA